MKRPKLLTKMHEWRELFRWKRELRSPAYVQWDWRYYVVPELVQEYLDKGKWRKIDKLWRMKEPKVRETIGRALRARLPPEEWAGYRAEVVGYMHKIAESDDAIEAKAAASHLAVCYLYAGRWESLQRLLTCGSLAARQGAAEGLAHAVTEIKTQAWMEKHENAHWRVVGLLSAVLGGGSEEAAISAAKGLHALVPLKKEYFITLAGIMKAAYHPSAEVQRIASQALREFRKDGMSLDTKAEVARALLHCLQCVDLDAEYIVHGRQKLLNDLGFARTLRVHYNAHIPSENALIRHGILVGPGNADILEFLARNLTVYYLEWEQPMEIQLLLREVKEGRYAKGIAHGIVHALASKAWEGQDIAPFLPALQKLRAESSTAGIWIFADIRKNATVALLIRHLFDRSSAGIRSLLETDDASTLRAAVGTIELAVRSNRDIAAALPPLEDMLASCTNDVRSIIAKTIFHYRINHRDIAALETAVKSDDIQVFYALQEVAASKDIIWAVPLLLKALNSEEPKCDKEALGILDTIANRSNVFSTSMEELERVESEIETFMAVRKNLPQAGNAEQLRRAMEIRSIMTDLVKSIADWKAELAREKNGKLLVGETIPKPAVKRGLYETVRTQRIGCR